MARNTGKVREKSGNFVSPEKWEPCFIEAVIGAWRRQLILRRDENPIRFVTKEKREPGASLVM